MLVKTILNNEVVLSGLCLIASLYIRLAHASGRWETRGDEAALRLWEEDKPFILAFWHGRILMMPYLWRRGVPNGMLISAHRDGRTIAGTMKHFGIKAITGSTSKGGMAAFRAILKSLKNGVSVGITPDGPRGPRMRASTGVVRAARMSGAPILTATFSAKRVKIFKSWDAFTFVWPFSKGLFLWGEVIQVDRNANEQAIEEARIKVETVLNDLTRRADEEMGLPVIEPAEAPMETKTEPGTKTQPATKAEQPPTPGEEAKPQKRRKLPPRGALLSLYSLVINTSAPLVRRHLVKRQKRGKEHPSRMDERLGHSTIKRPSGPLVWIHAASVGESLSALPLIEKLTGHDKDLHVLITTGTVTSAEILKNRLPPRCLHQFAPVDLSDAVERFLDHWQPAAALYVESEFWPNMIFATRQRAIPMVLVNARISPRSFKRWRQFPGAIARILSCFDLCLGQNMETSERLKKLGAPRVASAGNLKYAAAPLPADQENLSALHGQIDGRPFWVAASLHPGEGGAIAQAHEKLTGDFPGLITIVIPRHPNKGAMMGQAFAGQGIDVTYRSRDEGIKNRGGVYMADTMGEVGLFYHLAAADPRPVFMGGSLIPHGGQNPLEAALLGCPLVFGPHMFNFTSIGRDLVTTGAARQISHGKDLAGVIKSFLDAPEKAQMAGTAALEEARSKHAILDKVWQEILPFVPKRQKS